MRSATANQAIIAGTTKHTRKVDKGDVGQFMARWAAADPYAATKIQTVGSTISSEVRSIISAVNGEIRSRRAQSINEANKIMPNPIIVTTATIGWPLANKKPEVISIQQELPNDEPNQLPAFHWNRPGPTTGIEKEGI